jgi:hypothetical protein
LMRSKDHRHFVGGLQSRQQFVANEKSFDQS